MLKLSSVSIRRRYLAMSRATRYVSEEERLDIYDRLATKWALKMEAKMRDKQRELSRKQKGL